MAGQPISIPLREAFGRRKLDQIRRQEIRSFHAGLRNESLSPAYADHFIKLLRHALNLAVEWELLEKNPASPVHLFNEDNKVVHYLSWLVDLKIYAVAAALSLVSMPRIASQLDG